MNTLQANVMFGGVLFFTYFVGILSTVAGAFFSVNFVIAVTEGDLTPTGTNCIKKGLPGKLIFSKRKGLREVLFS